MFYLLICTTSIYVRNFYSFQNLDVFFHTLLYTLKTHLHQILHNHIPDYIKDAVQSVCKQRLCLHAGIQNIEFYSTTLFIFS
jgi:uncharacterized membrane protein